MGEGLGQGVGEDPLALPMAVAALGREAHSDGAAVVAVGLPVHIADFGEAVDQLGRGGAGHTIEEQARDSLPPDSFEAQLTEADAASEKTEASLRSMYALDAGQRSFTALDAFLDGLALEASRTPHPPA
jgi:hypothetical protein